MMQDAKARKYNVMLLFVGTVSVELNLERVRSRVVKGGHDVPEEDQRRRFPRSMRNLRTALSLADEAILYDNSTSAGFVKVATMSDGHYSLFEPLPEWATFLRTL